MKVTPMFLVVQILSAVCEDQVQDLITAFGSAFLSREEAEKEVARRNEGLVGLRTRFEVQEISLVTPDQDDGTMECPSCSSPMTVNVGHCEQCGGYT